MPHTTAQITKLANVSPQTVRNYTREYGELLSPQARGETGPRLFNDEDTRIFCAIVDLRKAGVPAAEIIERIRRGDVVIDVAPQAPPHEATNSPQAPQIAQDGPQALMVLQRDLQRQIDAVQRRLDARDLVAIYAAERRGAAVALVFVGFLLLFAWLLVNGG